MIRFLTYYEPNMSRSGILCAESARKFGADLVYEYERQHIDKYFYQNNKSILDTEFCESGTRPCAGFWLWKSYFINWTMLNANDGDIVCYVDAGCEIIADLNYIVAQMDLNGEDIFLFTNGLQHVHWCKMDVLAEICPGEGWQGDTYIDDSHQQVQASAMWIRVNDFTRKFIKEWLLWCQMPGMIDDSLSVLHNHPEFASHRYDQAILSCLQIKYSLRTHWWPDARWFLSQAYRWPEDKYPAILIHHRKRNVDY